MLSASGVVRLGHIEPRYFEPLSHVDALYRQQTTPASRPSLPCLSAVSDRSIFDVTKVRRFLFLLKPSDLQIEQ
jgi:hypothetical protein